MVTRNYKNFDAKLFEQELNILPWGIRESSDTVYDMFTTFHKLVINILNSHAPECKRSIKSKDSPWINKHLISIINYKNKLRRMLYKTHDMLLWNEFKKMRNYVPSGEKTSDPSKIFSFFLIVPGLEM
jgi:hypothetical protein